MAKVKSLMMELQDEFYTKALPILYCDFKSTLFFFVRMLLILNNNSFGSKGFHK